MSPPGPSSSVPSRSSIPSPLRTQIPLLSLSQVAALPYPPNVFPGSRDVQTSFGSMRVYEWGPETGRKVMLVHGDATSAPLWKLVATRLVERGWRVMVFDLWGRGYTDTPRSVRHEGRLYGLQLLFAASSSPLPWCTETFSIVGFSLGGAITMDFAASFPHLVRSVALLAPVGLLRGLPELYTNLRQAAMDGNKSESDLRKLLAGVLGVEEDPKKEPGSPLERREGGSVDADAIAQWQYDHHEGHATSFVSTLQYGPLQGQHDTWQVACNGLKDRQQARGGKERLLAICGTEDWVVPAQHVQEDLDGMMGQKEYVFETVKGGHSFLLDEDPCNRIVEVLVSEWTTDDAASH